MKLVDDWKTIATRAWSMHLWYLASALGGLNWLAEILPQLEAVLPRKLFLALSFLCGVAGLFLRLFPQFAEPPAPAVADPERMGALLQSLAVDAKPPAP